MKIEMKILNKQFYEEYQLPHYATAGSAAIDLVCTEDVTIHPGETKMISTGLAIWISSGYTHKQLSDVFDVSIAGLILPRSGLGTKGLILANTVGLIDEDYQGELMVSAWNRNETVGWENFYLDEGTKEHWLGKEPFEIAKSKDSAIILKAGDRFAQLLFIPVIKAQFDIVEYFSNNTHRGASGFGSTGK